MSEPRDHTHHLEPPTMSHGRSGNGRYIGIVSCSWGGLFAATWAALFHNEQWLAKTLYPLFDGYRHHLPQPIFSFDVHLREYGPIFTVHPGSACDAGVYPDTHYGAYGASFGTHNIDTLAQTLALFTLTSLWFGVVVERINICERLEDRSALEIPADQKREGKDIQISYSHPDGQRLNLYRVRVGKTEPKDYYLFEQDSYNAGERAEDALMGEGTQEFSEAELVRPPEWNKLPILAPVPNTEPEDEDWDDEDENSDPSAEEQ